MFYGYLINTWCKVAGNGMKVNSVNLTNKIIVEKFISKSDSKAFIVGTY